MFNLLVSSSLKNRLFVIAAALVLVAYGSWILPRVPVDVFPDLNRPRPEGGEPRRGLLSCT